MSFVPAAIPLLPPDGQPAHCAAFLHGILASARNWRSFGRRLVETRPAWEAQLVDLRCHGASADAPPPHTVAACADDLERLFGQLERPPALLAGHSFGGKVALALAARLPDGAPGTRALRQLWLIDAPAGADEATVPRSRTHALAVIEVLRSVPLPLPDRQALVAHLGRAGLPDVVASWMTTNLEPAPGGGFAFRFDLDGIEALYRDYAEIDLWRVLEAPPEGLRIEVVVGTRGVLGAEDRRRLAALAADGRIGVHEVAAGHWVHFESPDALLGLMAEAMGGED